MVTLADLQRPPDDDRATAPAGLALAVERVRTFDTPDFRGMTFLEVDARSALNRVKGMPFAWSVNPYRGCSHACSYCFARPTHAYLNLSPLGDFERTVVVKANVVEVLRRELCRPSWRGEHVAMGTNTDPYQRCEGRYALMPGIIAALARARTPLSILTKGTLITRDLDVLRDAAGQVAVSAALTVGMLDRGLWRRVEPGTPSPTARLRAVGQLNAAGIPTGVMLAPIMPGLNDDPEQLAELVERCVDAGAVHITPIVLHLRPGVREVFWPWLVEHHPELEDRYRRLYRSGNAAKAYRDAVCAFVAARRADAWRRRGRPAVPPSWRGLPDDRRPPVAADPQVPGTAAAAVPGEGTQLSLL